MRRVYDELGPDTVRRRFFIGGNDTHTSAEGAYAQAAAVVDGLRGLPQIGLSNYLRSSAAVARPPEPSWARGIEGQRRADLGNGFYLQSHRLRRPPGSLDPQGRRRLLHDVLVVRRLPGPGHLALARSGELATDRPDALPPRRVGLGAGPREAREPLLHLLSGHRAQALELRHLGRRHPRPVERPDRLEESAASIRATPWGPTAGGTSSSAPAISCRSRPTASRWPDRSRRSMTAGSTRPTGSWKDSRRRGRRSSRRATTTTRCSRRAARRDRPPAT